MTEKKTSQPLAATEHPPTRLDAAQLSNMAYPQASADAGAANARELQHIADMLAKLSPSNLQMVENIIRVIADEQMRDGD